MHNVPTFNAYNGTGGGSTTTVGVGTSITGDVWMMLAIVLDTVASKMLVYLFNPGNPNGLSASTTIALASQRPTSSSGACTIGRNADASPAVNANAFIETVGILPLALSLSALQGLYSTGIKGGA